MFDPKVVAFSVKSPISRRGKFFPEGYRKTWVTIWHKDPCKDGTDDSCGWFKRARHGDTKTLEAIEGLFRFNWDADYGGWFSPDGPPLMSSQGIVLQMFMNATWEHFGHNKRRRERFMWKHLVDILSFAENTVDSLHSGIIGKYGFSPRDERIKQFAYSVYGCVLRWDRPWYRHPRFHVHHWRIQIHPLQSLLRWFKSGKAVTANTEAVA
jgi:hypothetical protein